MNFDTHKPINQSSWTGYEKDTSHKIPNAFKPFGVKMFSDNFGRTRFVIEGKAGLLINKQKYIEAENTVAEYQGQHFMKGLVAVANAVLGHINEDGNHTDDRKKFK